MEEERIAKRTQQPGETPRSRRLWIRFADAGAQQAQRKNIVHMSLKKLAYSTKKKRKKE